MMRIGWSSGKKKVGIGRLIDWLVGIPSLLEFRHCEEAKQGEQSRSGLTRLNKIASSFVSLTPRNDEF